MCAAYKPTVGCGGSGKPALLQPFEENIPALHTQLANTLSDTLFDMTFTVTQALEAPNRAATG